MSVGSSLSPRRDAPAHEPPAGHTMVSCPLPPAAISLEKLECSCTRFRMSIATVTLPTAPTKRTPFTLDSRAFSSTFLQLATLMTTAPSLTQATSSLYCGLGTPRTTMSADFTASSTVRDGGGTSSCPRLKTYILSTSTLYTVAPSLAIIAASGRPTTSERLTTTAVL